MKVSREKAEQNRELVVETAGKLFREHGFDGIGVADLMKHAGLTVGGFYKNFDSKEDLLAESCKRISDNTLEKWKDYAADPSIPDPFKRIGISYLSPKNRDDLAKTCIYSTLAGEVPRHEDAVKKVFSDGTQSIIDFLATIVAGETEEERRAKAIITFSQWVGALMLSRAAGQSELSDEILKAARIATNVE